MSSNRFVTVLSVLAMVAAGFPARAAESDWLQWGGPRRDFSVLDDPGLTTSWGDSGPNVLWRKALGDHGHSAIVVEGSTLYTAFRRGDQDVLLAADLATGETKWERAYDSPLPENHNHQFGPGPHSTPLVVGDRVFTTSAGILLSGFDKNSGESLWQRDLTKEEEVPFMNRGYGASPVAWGDLLIVNGGGNGQGVIALRQGDGTTAWKALDGGGSYSSPVLMTLDGVEQLVVSLGARRAGLDPSSGEVLWQLDLPETAQTTMATQVQVGSTHIFTSSAYGDGSRLYEVRRVDGEWQAEELWYLRKMRIMHGSVAHIGNHLYGSSGDFGPTFLSAVDLESGELTFRQRGFAKANLMRVGERVLILDEDGTLAIGDPTPEGIEILTSASVLDGVSWTPPTLVGTTLLVRNREEMLALDLATAVGDVSVTEAATDSGDAAVADFERTAAGLTVVVPPSLLDGGSVYYLTPGEDAQIIVQSETALQRTTLVSDRVIGAMVVPFDLDAAETLTRPILGGSLRIPVSSLKGGSGQIRRVLFGAQGLDAGAHPEITVTFLEASDVEVVATDSSDSTRLELVARVRVQGNGKEVEVEAPVQLDFQGSNMGVMMRNVGDLATLRSSFELDVAELGVQVPPQLGVVLSSQVTVDLFLGFSTVTPDKTLDPSLTQEQFAEETRFLVLARDLGDDTAAYEHFQRLMADSWSDADRLERLALAAVAEPGIERRNLGLALEAATRANELEEGKDALLLNTLARIQFERGDVDAALASQRSALTLIDEQRPRARGGLEGNLRRYEEALAARR